MHKLFESCVYTIRVQRSLAAAADGRMILEEKKAWTSAKKMLESARSKGEQLAVVFADAGDTSELVAWSVLTWIRVEGKKTKFKIGPLWRLTGKTPQDLTRALKHEKVKEGTIWPYILCETPDFLRRAAGRPLPWVYRDPARPLNKEGRKRLVTHLSRERSVKLVRELKSAHMIRNGGRLPCEVCGFDFARSYGDIGIGFAEAHHIVPLAAAPDRGRPVTVNDLIVVCSNCHRMLHAGPHYPSIEALRKRVKQHK